MRKLAPGVYMDGDTLHLDVPEMLSANGYADTPENRDLMVEVARKVCREAFPEAEQIVTETGELPRLGAN